MYQSIFPSQKVLSAFLWKCLLVEPYKQTRGERTNRLGARPQYFFFVFGFPFTFLISGSIHTCHPLPFLQYSPLIEFCDQLAWGAFKILKALILTSPIKMHSLKLWCKAYEINPFLNTTPTTPSFISFQSTRLTKFG